MFTVRTVHEEKMAETVKRGRFAYELGRTAANDMTDKTGTLLRGEWRKQL